MKLKFWICLIVIVAGLGVWIQKANPAHITYAELRQQLKYRLATSSPDFEDADLDLCLDMAGMAMLNHGLALSKEMGATYTTLDSGEQYLWIGIPGSVLPVLFVWSVSKLREGYINPEGLETEISLMETDIKDIGHRELDTDVPVSYYCFFHSHDTAYIYVYPAPIESTQLYVEYYSSVPADLGDYFRFNPAYEEILLDYALMIAWLRIENWRDAATVYNSYQQGIAILREEIVNKQPDITVGHKIIK